MADTIQLEIVTPERLVVRDVAEELQIPGKNGYLGILPDHAPLITELGVGLISYLSAGKVKFLAVAWGFAEVLGDKVTILAETAERAEEIDVPRAEAARRRAMEALAGATGESLQALQDALARAESRLQAAYSAGRADVAHIAP